MYFNIPYVHPILGKEIGIRLYGVDTPELRTKYKKEKQMGYEARAFVETVFNKAKIVELKNIRRGKYFRIIAEIWIDGVSLAKLLIEAGYAKEYYGGTKEKWEFE